MRLRNESIDAERLARGQLDQVLNQGLTVECYQGGPQIAGSRGTQPLAVTVEQAKGDRRVPDRGVRNDIHDVTKLGALRLQELAPRRERLEQRSNRDLRPDRPAVGRLVNDGVVTRNHLSTGRPSVRRRGDGQLGNGGDAGERLAAKPQCADARQIVHGPQLAGAVALDGELQFNGRNAEAVVSDLNEAQTALVHFDRHPLRAGVDGVFDQLLDHRGWALDYLTRGDLARNLGREAADVHASAARRSS